MLNPIREMLKNISRGKTFFFSSLISLIVVFTLIDILISTVLNINEIKARMENSNQVIVYVKTMTQDEISAFQGKLFSTPGVKTLKYESKETAIKKLSDEIKMDLSLEENPLSDSFYLYVSKDADINKLKAKILSYPEVEELNMREKEIEHTNTFSKNLDRTIIFGSIGLLAFGIILIYNLTSFGIKARHGDIIESLNLGVSKLFIKFTYFLEGILLILISSGLGFLLFFKFQKIAIQGINTLNNKLLETSTNSELLLIFLMSFLLGLLITLFVNFIAMTKYYKTSGSISSIKTVEEKVADYDENK